MTKPEVNGNDKTAAGGVVDYIRSKILLGEYGPDGRLVEEQIAGELGVSRTPVRQALTAIEAEGLVEIFPNRGAIVASFSPDEVWKVYDLRAAVEGLAVRRAAESIDEAELDELRLVWWRRWSVSTGSCGRRTPPRVAWATARIRNG